MHGQQGVCCFQGLVQCKRTTGQNISQLLPDAFSSSTIITTNTTTNTWGCELFGLPSSISPLCDAVFGGRVCLRFLCRFCPILGPPRADGSRSASAFEQLRNNLGSRPSMGLARGSLAFPMLTGAFSSFAARLRPTGIVASASLTAEEMQDHLRHPALPGGPSWRPLRTPICLHPRCLHQAHLTSILDGRHKRLWCFHLVALQSQPTTAEARVVLV
mmetsp:Transcript_162721/g.517009  ORF Transcript_162721/g.517009 Transcript_162721/m.517009 type:complete len:216 (-) Transcript_162721:1065-1712(-)